MKIIKTIAGWIKVSWAILGITVLMLALLEGGLSLIFHLNDLRRPPRQNFRATADTYSDPAWAASYYKEIDDVEKGGTIRWNPYSYWRRAEFRGKYINIGTDGLRRTHAAVAADGAGSPVKVFMFGGSTLWGLGADDESTIPSIFAKETQNRGTLTKVVNFGQYAFVSTQGVIELIRQLQKGNIPDTVIFLDGVNDTFGAFQNRVAGLAHSEFDRELLFNNAESSKLAKLAAQSTIRNLSIVRFFRGVITRTGLQRDSLQPYSLRFDPPIQDKRALAQSVIDVYFNNMKIVQALSRTYNFEFICYWQPVIFTKQYLSDYEKRSMELDFNYPGMKEFYLDTYSLMQQRGEVQKNETSFHNISSIFQDVHEPVYVDFNHMGEKGNSVIARRMVDDFLYLHKPTGKPETVTESQLHHTSAAVKEQR